MSTTREVVVRCDKCGRPAGEDGVSITHYVCGHDACNSHVGNYMRSGYEHAWVKEMCPICNPPKEVER